MSFADHFSFWSFHLQIPSPLSLFLSFNASHFLMLFHFRKKKTLFRLFSSWFVWSLLHFCFIAPVLQLFRHVLYCNTYCFKILWDLILVNTYRYLTPMPSFNLCLYLFAPAKASGKSTYHLFSHQWSLLRELLST